MTNRQETPLRSVLGVTGSIATGKSTVADMLVDCGAPMIDFDLLAREVVEPDQPAWNDIVHAFGKQVLNADRSLNRAALSRIVFQDESKRKQLESFTHPRIQELFQLKRERLIKDDPDLIIQAVVPLLFEVKMQHLFRKVLLVYAPPEVQKARLMSREKIDAEEASRRIRSQIPIDEKVPISDYVVYNDRSPEETQRQVEALWPKIRSDFVKSG